MSDFLYIDQKTRTNVEKTSQANISKDLFENYRIDRSLRFNSADSAYLSRTPAGAGNRKIWTFSAWAKRTTVGAAQSNHILGNAQAPSGTNGLFFGFSSNTLLFGDYGASGWTWYVQSASLHRDVSSWYHVVAQHDTTQVTASERIKLYVNGVRLTAFDGASTYPTLDFDGRFNQASVEMAIGRLGTYNGNYFDGYLAEINFIDGQALTPSSFGFFDNQRDFTWKPKKYSGSYGNNGFYLNFSNNSSASLLGKDFSGNGNNWTPNNLSVTAGAGNDSLVDTPTSYGTDTGAGDEVRGNYATLNPLFGNTGGTITDGNLKLTHTGGANGKNALGVSSVAMSSGKWYGEVTSITANQSSRFGIFSTANTSLLTSANPYVGTAVDGYSVFAGGGTFKENNNITTAITNFGGSAPVAGDVYMVALDLDNNKVWFGRNGSWANNGNPATGTAETFSILSGRSYYFACNNYTDQQVANFGQRAFAYTAPSGFKALCTTNLPIPRIKKPSLNFDVVTYTGNGGTQTISGLAFEPDFVWLKGRSVAYSHQLYDQVRGAGKLLNSNSTNGESTVTDNLTAFTSAGFTLGNDSGTNQSSATYVAWAWDAGTTTASNTQGSITSQVRANSLAGFSIVTYTGNGTAGATVGHGLGVSPSMIITKKRSTATSSQWTVGFSALGWNRYILLNSTAAAATDSNVWNSAPTSSVFYLGNDIWNNHSGQTTIAYCFAEVEGYSKFGSYTGNGSADGPFVYCGFRPRFVLTKNSSSGAAGYDWVIWDAARNPSNQTAKVVFPDLGNAEEETTTIIDILSSGFKLRNSGATTNAGTMIFAAFAESPFKYARAR